MEYAKVFGEAREEPQCPRAEQVCFDHSSGRRYNKNTAKGTNPLLRTGLVCGGFRQKKGKTK